MTVPSTEELQRLLDETPHETWRAEIDEGNEWWNVVPSRFGGSHTLIAVGMSQPVAELMAESRVLAAEVIRLREENERMQERVNKHAQDALRLTKFLHDHHPVVHAEFKSNLTRILEGDQE